MPDGAVDGAASDRAAMLKIVTHQFHGVMFRGSCADLKADFQEIKRDSTALRAAVAADPDLGHRSDFTAAVERLRRKIQVVAAPVQGLG